MRIWSVLYLSGGAVSSLVAGEGRLFDGTNYPKLPQAFGGATVGDYRTERTMDAPFDDKYYGGKNGG